MSDFSTVSKKIFGCDPNIRGLTVGRFDGEILHFEMRPDVVTLNPPGVIGKMDTEVLFPTLDEYFENHKKFFGELSYMVTKFERVSLVYLKHKNIFIVLSVEPQIDVYPVTQKVKSILVDELGNGSQNGFDALG